MDKLQKAQELEREAQKLRMEASVEKHIATRQAEEDFKRSQNIDVYTSDDYCGLETNKYSFYYGYEVTVCPKHNLDCPDECELAEWAFQATVNGEIIMTLPQSKLHPTSNEEPFWYLVAGIGHFLEKLNQSDQKL